jgi:hypothetical protein
MAVAESAKVLQFPVWPEPKRGTPNSFLRSALFSAIQGKDRRFLDGEILASQGDYTVKFTGKQLNQEDLTVWETLVHLARQNQLGNICNFTAHGLLKALGLPTGGKNHSVLHSSIIRLTACAVEIIHDNKKYFGSLVEGGAKDELTKHYVIRLNPDLIRLYGDTQWTAIDWQQRLQLRRKPLAQSLHAYFSSHKKPFPVTLNFLRKITGSRNSHARNFKILCKKALDELVTIDFIESYNIEDDRVTIVRALTPVPSQK